MKISAMVKELTMTDQSTASKEPSISLPISKMLLAIFVSSLATSLGWMLVVKLGDFKAGTMAAGLAGAGLVMGTGFLVVVLMKPWRSRPVGDWANIWLAGTIGRLLITPGAAYLLYSATPLSWSPLLLSVAMSYVIVQISEAAVLSLHLKSIT